MYNDHLLSQLADTYQAEKLAEAEKARLLKLTRAGRPVLRQRVFAWSGDRLIALGWALKKRYESDALNPVAELAVGHRFGQIRGPLSQERRR
jgi:hypothetical protein